MAAAFSPAHLDTITAMIDRSIVNAFARHQEVLSEFETRLGSTLVTASDQAASLTEQAELLGRQTADLNTRFLEAQPKIGEIDEGLAEMNVKFEAHTPRPSSSLRATS